MNAREFLHALWGDLPSPSGPFIQTWDLATKRSGYYASPIGVAVDGEPDVYTGVGLAGARLGASRRAKSSEVAAIAGLWLDIDVKPGSCPEQHHALWLANVHVRPTLTIDSGNGIHAWWLFCEPWLFRTISDRDAAVNLTARWQQLHRLTARAHGWALDSTHDLARLMRLPGTINTKGEPRPVQVIDADGPSRDRAWYEGIVARVVIDAPAPTATATGQIALDLAAPTDAFAGKLDALLANSPELTAVWTQARRFPSASEADLSVCSLAADAMNDAELARLIHERRKQHGDPLDKAQRTDYLRRTIQTARTKRMPNTTRSALDALARRAA